MPIRGLPPAPRVEDLEDPSRRQDIARFLVKLRSGLTTSRTVLGRSTPSVEPEDTEMFVDDAGKVQVHVDGNYKSLAFEEESSAEDEESFSGATVLNALSFQADPTGLTFSDAAAQRMIRKKKDDLTRAVFYWPAGRYRFAGGSRYSDRVIHAIGMDDNTMLVGDGDATLLELSAVKPGSDVQLVWANESRNLVVRDLHLDMRQQEQPSATTNTLAAIKFNRCSGIRIGTMLVSNGTAQCISIFDKHPSEDYTLASVRGLRTDGASGVGVLFDRVIGGLIQGCTLRGDGVDGSTGAHVRDCVGVDFTGNYSSKWVWNGLSAGARVAGLCVESTGLASGVSCHDLVLSGNLFDDIEPGYTTGLTYAPAAMLLIGTDISATKTLQGLTLYGNRTTRGWSGTTPSATVYRGLRADHVDSMMYDLNNFHGTTVISLGTNLGAFVTAGPTQIL